MLELEELLTCANVWKVKKLPEIYICRDGDRYTLHKGGLGIHGKLELVQLAGEFDSLASAADGVATQHASRLKLVSAQQALFDRLKREYEIERNPNFENEDLDQQIKRLKLKWGL